VLHDFDKAGFSILGTLQRSSERYWFRHRPQVTDLGLRLDDVQTLGLESEASFDRGSQWSIKKNLRKNGATEDEIGFLLEERVELNALPSDTLIEWIETKLDNHGVKKVIPDHELLDDAYRHALATTYAEDRCEDVIQEARTHGNEAEVPGDLTDQVAKLLEKCPHLSWHDVIRSIAAEHDDEEDE
jgi:hypothetical protein